MLEKLSKIEFDRPVDLIISQIRELISSGTIKPGEKLPPERKLAERLGVSRGQVREAIRKLEVYGIVKIRPQSGTVVSGIGLVALEGLLTDILKIEKTDFKALVDTRVLLDKESARLAAMHRTSDNLIQMSKALDLYEKRLADDSTAIEEDMLFHLKIAEASNNKVLRSLILIITPDILKSYNNLNVCDKRHNNKTIEEHRNILEMISERDPDGALACMEQHLESVVEFSLRLGESGR